MVTQTCTLACMVAHGCVCWGGDSGLCAMRVACMRFVGGAYDVRNVCGMCVVCTLLMCNVVWRGWLCVYAGMLCAHRVEHGMNTLKYHR